MEAFLLSLERDVVPYQVDEGEATFYGPKIDLKVNDALRREWQLSTIQFDFTLPECFDLSFAVEGGQHHRPYMVHRALLGSMECFMGVLIEHFGGASPFGSHLYNLSWSLKLTDIWRMRKEWPRN